MEGTEMAQTTTAKARLAAMHARGRASLEPRTTRELCDMYVVARTKQSESTGDDFRTVCITLSWIGDVLEHRDRAAYYRWLDAEEAIDLDMIDRDEWVAGASALPPHPFFDCH
ncbi:hypothetical protein [Nonomuraea sp. NPDC050786]|uniref:hypothetical protein n=1 Tax=Nonomuraea sp. NPDC050786 TaxID=3154840 RepID=UPI0033F066C5